MNDTRKRNIENLFLKTSKEAYKKSYRHMVEYVLYILDEQLRLFQNSDDYGNMIKLAAIEDLREDIAQMGKGA